MTVLREMVVVHGSAIYCNLCNRHGPSIAYDLDGHEVIEVASCGGWDCSEKRDLCPDCSCKLKDGTPIP